MLQTYRRVLGEAFDDPDGIVVIDDTGFAKKGRHSVGVTRQYSGTLGKTDNCQVAVSLHYAAPKGDYPLALRLFLPESWTSQPDRMQAARVPLEHQTHRTKNETALDLLDSASGRALDRAGMRPSEIGAIVVVSTTGIATPSLDALLIERMRLMPTVQRLPSSHGEPSSLPRHWSSPGWMQ